MNKFAYSLLAYYNTNLIYEKYFFANHFYVDSIQSCKAKDYSSWFVIEWECLCKS